MDKQIILGISCFYHDSAACVLVDGEIISASQEERFTRKKHDSSFPINSINSCLKIADIRLEEVNHVVFYDKPFIKFERLLETYIAFAPKGFKSFLKSMPIWLKEKLFLKKLLHSNFKEIDKNFSISKLNFSEHHFSHAASAFYPSPFNNAVILTLDGVGEWTTSSVAIGDGNNLKIVKEIHFPHSLGLLYSAFTYYLGFRVNSGEYKVMGLAPYGVPTYKDLILNELIDLKEDGSFRLNMKYFDYPVGLTMVNKKFAELFGRPIRTPDKDNLDQFHMDVAASIQEVIELIVIKISNALFDEYEIDNLCLAGGVALNCVANGKVLRDSKFTNIWIQPAAGDAGGSLGASLAYYHHELGYERGIIRPDAMKGSYLGPSFSNEDVKKELKDIGAVFTEYNEIEMLDKTAELLSGGLALGWFQGRMEFGPRSLGARSIIADPRSGKMQKQLNLKVKFRESFRPFAPAVLREDLEEYFELKTDSPYMLIVSEINKKLRIDLTKDQQNLFGIEKLNIKNSNIPAVTHVDYSARVQTVHSSTNLRFHSLLQKFKEKTGCSVLVNTSFNVRGEPIVCSPEDAFRCFMGTGLDALVIGNYILIKDEQNKNLLADYKDKFAKD